MNTRTSDASAKKAWTIRILPFLPPRQIQSVFPLIYGQAEKGIIICGTGIGVSICANKVKGIRCALCGDVLSAELTRQHNDSNMLAMGGRIIGVETAKAITKSWLETEFTGGRHQRRIDKISEYEG